MKFITAALLLIVAGSFTSAPTANALSVAKPTGTYDKPAPTPCEDDDTKSPVVSPSPTPYEEDYTKLPIVSPSPTPCEEDDTKSPVVTPTPTPCDEDDERLAPTNPPKGSYSAKNHSAPNTDHPAYSKLMETSGAGKVASFACAGAAIVAAITMF